MPIDMDTFELNSDDFEDGGCDDFGNLGTPRQRLEPIITRIGRSLEEILELEVEIINECTDLDPTTWINCYAKRFREILTDDPTLTKFQVKYLLYMR